MDLSPIQILGGVLGGSGASSFFGWLSQRGQQKNALEEAANKAVVGALQGVSDQLHRTDERLKLMEGHHERCTADLAEVRRRLDESERDRNELKRQIESLMQGPPASYDAKAMRRVGKP